ncbi:patatin-like phospholipase family protein [Pararhizobium sp.]|uniref:patatin-like phospholipase family protein n=1 Tax=Pararhizobium sp. TaxID=1977563 RepID=UPI002728AD4F|nr:patatin-like phospholipase family protein [Pararhizobium sp.]MDO9415804.1 patatin-like phospholipase family protein [Pararhizobium sp.]
MAVGAEGTIDPNEAKRRREEEAAAEASSRNRSVPTRTFSTVFAEELAELRAASETKAESAAGPPQKGQKAQKPQKPQDPKEIGLSLSGGGIRSAAFSLGVLQALHVAQFFPKIDFLSTVSGGGYTGAALIAGIKRNGGKFPFGMDDSTNRLGMGANEIADNDAVQGLRDRSRYLMPNGKFDLVVSLGIILRGLMVNAVMVATAIFLAAAITLFFNPTEELLRQPWVYSALGWSDKAGTDYFGPWLVLTKLLIAGLAIWLVLWALVRSATRSDGDHSDPGSWWAVATAVILVALSIVLLCEIQPPVIAKLLRWSSDGNIQNDWVSFQKTVMALGAGNVLLAFVWRKLVGYMQAADKNSVWRARFDKLVGGLPLILLAATLPLLIYVLYLWVSVLGLRKDAVPAILTSAQDRLGVIWFLLLPVWLMTSVAHWSAKVGTIGETLLNKAWWKSGSVWQRDSLQALAAIGFLLALTLILCWILDASMAAEQLGTYRIAFNYLAIAMMLAMTGGLFTENANSLHRLYRDRLNSAFDLGDKHKKGYKLTDLVTVGSGAAERPLRPQLIVNAAVNIQNSETNKRGRDAGFFTFTSRYVGSDVTGYVPAEAYQKAEPDLDLATTVAISGAAVSSAMGRAGPALVAPTLALLNLRLAYWLRNPARVLVSGHGKRLNADDWKLPYLFFEMFKLLNEKHAKVYVSDGGHIDNLGLYQLLKRRCDVIVVSDAEADPAMTFASFVDVERFARIDLGIRMEVPVATIREAVLKRQAELKKADVFSYSAPAHAHAVFGKISYPAMYDGETQIATEKEGILVYIKATVTGDESTYVLDYEKRYPSFPHESTGDQFFSEEQFEAYRALGFHATSHGLKDSAGTPQSDGLRNKLQVILTRDKVEQT